MFDINRLGMRQGNFLILQIFIYIFLGGGGGRSELWSRRLVAVEHRIRTYIFIGMVENPGSG